jgi:mRNA interferase MazF
MIAAAAKQEILDVERGELFWVDLNPVIGSEQGNRRPCLVISPNALNRIGGNRTVMVLPITSKGQEDKLRMPLRAGDIEGFALIQQQRVLDKRRLQRSAGHIEPVRMDEILQRIRQFYT